MAGTAIVADQVQLGLVNYASGSDTGSPTNPTVGGSGSGGESEASEIGLNGPSIIFDKHSGTCRLAPLLNYNRSSVLSGDAWWTENYVSSELSLRGNRTEIIESSPGGGDQGSSNLVGWGRFIQNTLFAAGYSGPVTKKLIKVFGYGKSRPVDNTSYIDLQSSRASNQMNNIFDPQDGGNEWREQSIAEAALGLSGSGPQSVDVTFIRPNTEYFRKGQNPLTAVGDVGSDSTIENLFTERNVSSRSDLPENASFAVQWNYYSSLTPPANGSTLLLPSGKPFFRIYWGGKYCFQFNNPEAYFIPDTTKPKSEWQFIAVDTLKLASKDGKQLVTLVFEVVGNSILISNAEDSQKHDKKSDRPSWCSPNLTEQALEANSNSGVNSKANKLVVAASKLIFSVRGLDIAFTYIPVVYPEKGMLSVRNLDIDGSGFSTSGLHFKKITHTADVMGGIVQGNIVNDGTYGYDLLIQRGAVDKTPAVYSAELESSPQLSSVGLPNLTNIGIRKINISLGVDRQTGSITLDNRDGALSRLGGIFPVEITAGWAPSGPNQVIFKGFAENQQTNKSVVASSITLSLIGRDRVLWDAIAVNLPVYDGYDDAAAINDLLTRSGWSGTRNVQGGYQLSIPAALVPPRWIFPMGKSIMACIQDIALAAGKWAFVDNLGVFNYIAQSSSYGTNIGAFREVPSAVGSYDEWLSLGSTKESIDTRNAVMVVGLTGVDRELPVPVVGIRKDSGGSVGDMQSGTYIPWYRWIIYQDPKLNDVNTCQAVAERIFENNNRLRINVQGQVWGRPDLTPWSKFAVDLKIDDVGIPDDALYRIISVEHTLDADDGTYWCSVHGEWIDPSVKYTNWWDSGGGY